MPDQVLCTVAQVTSTWPQFANLAPAYQTMLINSSSQAVINHCNQTFDQQSLAELKNGNNTGILWLNKRPVIQINLITIFNGSLVLDNSSGQDWVFYPKSGKLVRGTGLHDERFSWFWPKGNRNIEIDYVAGWSAIPDNVIMAACMFCRGLYNRINNPGIFQSESIGDYSYTIAPVVAQGGLSSMGIPTYIADLLAPYVTDISPH
jgi:hypothetical protein